MFDDVDDAQLSVLRWIWLDKVALCHNMEHFIKCF